MKETCEYHYYFEPSMYGEKYFYMHIRSYYLQKSNIIFSTQALNVVPGLIKSLKEIIPNKKSIFKFQIPGCIISGIREIESVMYDRSSMSSTFIFPLYFNISSTRMKNNYIKKLKELLNNWEELSKNADNVEFTMKLPPDIYHVDDVIDMLGS